MKVNLCGYEFEVTEQEWFWEKINEWEPESFEIIKKFANNNKIFIDCGAWNGVLSLPASKMYKTVYCFEPDLEAFNILNKNIKLNNLDIIVSSEGISNIDGFTKLYGNTGNSMSSITLKEGNEKTIKVIKLSHFINKINDEIGLIKIDIEGGEELVIPEIFESLKNNLPSLYISFHPFWFENLNSIEIIAELLFSIYKCFGPNMEIIDKDKFIYGLKNNSNVYIFTK